MFVLQNNRFAQWTCYKLVTYTELSVYCRSMGNEVYQVIWGKNKNSQKSFIFQIIKKDLNQFYSFIFAKIKKNALNVNFLNFL